MNKAIRSNSITTPWLDFLLIGGGSILVYLGFKLAGDLSQGHTNKVSWLMYYFGYIVNWPHFMISYYLLYKDFKSQRKKIKFIWASWIVPAILISYMIFCFSINSAKYLSYLINLMFITVGWHYCKQIYGIATVYALKNGMPLSKREQYIFRFNLYSVAIVNLCWANSYQSTTQYFGISYTNLFVPNWVYQCSLWSFYLSVILVAYTFYKRWREEEESKRVLPLSSWVTLLSIHIWWIPMFVHQFFYGHVVAFFHSLQYLLIVYLFKKNQIKKQFKKMNSSMLIYIMAFIVSMMLAGWIGFEGLPKLLDKTISYKREIFGSQVFVLMFTVFINIHHYFIDNVIWRKDNSELKTMFD